MAGVTTTGLPIVQPQTVAGVATTNPYAHVTGTSERVPMDTYLASGGIPQSVGAQPFALAALAAGMIANRTTLTSNAGTLATTSGLVTTESLSTAAGATQGFTVTNSLVAATSNIVIDVHNGTNQFGAPALQSLTPAAGSFSAVIVNNGTAAFNGTLQIPFKLG